jgi:RNA methyltransferase, TrmH family
MDITSLQNPKVKYIVKLRDDRRQRQNDGLMLVEGFDEISFAISAGYKPQTLLTAPEIASRQIKRVNTEIFTVNRTVFEKISYRENPDGWLGVFPVPKTSLDDLKLSVSPLVIVAESIEKPGNLGAILRTADAANVDAVLVCDPRVDLWNPNVVRASRGTVFTVPTIETENSNALAWLRSRKIGVFAATPTTDKLYTDVNLREPVAITVGTEDKGLTDFWLSNANMKVKIPMLGKVNSLNVSIAAALIIYEAVRQRNNLLQD